MAQVNLQEQHPRTQPRRRAAAGTGFGSSMVWSICEQASTRGLPVFLLGGDHGVADRAAEVFRQRYPGLEIAGTSCPRSASRTTRGSCSASSAR